MISADKIRQYALEAGFSLCGIANAKPLDTQTAHLERWLADGYDSGLEYMHRNRDKRADPTLLFEGARTVVVCAVNYKNEYWNQIGSTAPKISSYALSRDYHTTIKEMLREVLNKLTHDYPGIKGRCFVDSAPIFEKAWAVEAGMGWRGKNSLILTPQFGSFIFLGEILLDVEANECNSPSDSDRCGTCTACMDACPNGAIIRPGTIDTSRCISRLTVEKFSENNTDSGHSDTHGWIFGCDICQAVCPYNKRTSLFSNQAFAPLFNPVKATKEFWKNLYKEESDRLFKTTPMGRAGFERIKEMADNFYSTGESDE